MRMHLKYLLRHYHRRASNYLMLHLQLVFLYHQAQIRLSKDDQCLPNHEQMSHIQIVGYFNV